jgi:GNAT superfamily N-acetyltransferase
MGETPMSANTDAAAVDERAPSLSRCRLDELDDLLRFRRAVHGEQSTFADESYLRWMYLGHPAADPAALSCWTCRSPDGHVIGQIGGYPVGLRIGDEHARAFWTLDGAVEPGHRGRGIFGRLLQPAAVERAVAMVTESSPSATKAMLRAGWIDLGTLPIFIRPLRIGSMLQTRGRSALGETVGLAADLALWSADRLARVACAIASLDLEEISRFDGRADAIWEKASRSYRVICSRDSATLNWRFVDFPKSRYRSFYLRRHGEAIGYVVLSLGSRGRDPAGIIVDFLCEPPWIPGLLALCLQFFRAERMSTVCCLHRNPVSTAAFAALGFARRDTGWPFLAKPRSVSAAGLALVRDPGNWFLTGADSDLDRPRPEDVSARPARASG